MRSSSILSAIVAVAEEHHRGRPDGSGGRGSRLWRKKDSGSPAALAMLEKTLASLPHLRPQNIISSSMAQIAHKSSSSPKKWGVSLAGLVVTPVSLGLGAKDPADGASTEALLRDDDSTIGGTDTGSASSLKVDIEDPEDPGGGLLIDTVVDNIQRSDGNIRWAILASACMIMFGNYYAYDLPAALNKPLQYHLGADDEPYQYQLNLFYSLYSFPNIVLPFFGGFLVDMFGTRKLMTVLSLLVCLGQMLFAIGVSSKSYWVMHLGRVIFGVGGESLSVAQTKITTKWFKGKELAFALGVNLSVSRLGSVFNDFISPHIAVNISVPVAVWIGFVSCVISLVSGLLLNSLDSYGTHKFRRRTNNRQTSQMAMRSLESSTPMVVTPAIVSSSPGGITRRLSEGSTTSPSQRSSVVNSQMRSAPRRPARRSILGQVDFSSIFSFNLAFWQICMIMCLMYAIVVPFNTIHSAFLQTRWFPNDPKTAGQVMALPDVISAVLVPFCGTFVDVYGRRVRILTLCGALMAIVHLILGLFPVTIVTSPLPPLMLLGFSYALLLTFWPCIPLVVPEKSLATAFGLATATQNAALTLFPVIVAALVNYDPTYTVTEMFFVVCSLMGVMVCLWLHHVDSTMLGGVLERAGDSGVITAAAASSSVHGGGGGGGGVLGSSSQYRGLQASDDILDEDELEEEL